jgi:hypothetical protein
MEKVNDILNNIKERFSNPLIFSFICSWLIINWQITVGLIWYDTDQIEKEGNVSIFQFIQSKININDSLWHPLAIAICYTIFIPVIKNLIRAFYAWTSKWGENWNLKILDGGQISINKYLKLRADHQERSKILEEVISSESSYIHDYDNLKTELLSVQANLNETKQRLNSAEIYINDLHNTNILKGSWVNNYELPNGEKGSEQIYIEHSKYYVISKFGLREHKFDIRDFTFDTRNGIVFFVKEISSNEKTKRSISEYYNINRLNFEGNDLLVGTENGDTKIEYRRK